VLEDSLTDFAGAIILVTHDRFMLDRVCTEILGLDGSGRVGRYGDCAQWQAAQARAARGQEDVTGRRKSKKAKGKVAESGLSASEAREFRDMEETIQEAESRVQQCVKAAEDPTVSGDHFEAQERWQELESARKQVETLYARWEELESRMKAGA
jgi:ATP-binding cassette subfamily F protein uup